MGVILKINGKEHRMTIVGGKEVYDPPLDKKELKKADARLEEMLALQSPPRLMTDNVFFEGIGTLDQQMGQEDLTELLAESKKHGYTPNRNDVYMENLARFPGDPEAFVSPTGGRGHIKKVCEERGWRCHGAVEVKGREPETDPWEKRIPLAEDHVQKEIGRLKKSDSKAEKASESELRQEVVNKFSVT